jgi:hypothetical protein
MSESELVSYRVRIRALVPRLLMVDGETLDVVILLRICLSTIKTVTRWALNAISVVPLCLACVLPWRGAMIFRNLCRATFRKSHSFPIYAAIEFVRTLLDVITIPVALGAAALPSRLVYVVLLGVSLVRQPAAESYEYDLDFRLQFWHALFSGLLEAISVTLGVVACITPSRTRLLLGGLYRIYITEVSPALGSCRATDRYDTICRRMARWSFECGVSAIIDVPFLLVFAAASVCPPSGATLVWNCYSFYTSPSGQSEIRAGWNQKLPVPRSPLRSTRRARCQTNSSLASPLLSNESFPEQVRAVLLTAE